MGVPDKTVPWDAVAAIRSSGLRNDVFVALGNKPRFAAELAADLDREVSRQQVSNRIHELKANGLVECLTPDRPHHRIYGLTERGLKAFNSL